jgi:hypothetical protein
MLPTASSASASPSAVVEGRRQGVDGGAARQRGHVINELRNQLADLAVQITHMNLKVNSYLDSRRLSS